MKKVLLVILFLLLLIAVPLTVFLVKQQQDLRQRATPATTLYFEPPTLTKAINQTVTLVVNIDTGDNLVQEIALDVTYDPTFLEAVSIEKGTFLGNVVKSGVVGSGSVSITLGADPTAPKSGKDEVAQITFKTLAQVDSTAVSFGENTQVKPVGGNETNVLIGSQGAKIKISDSTALSGQSTFADLVQNISPAPTPVATTTKINLPLEGAIVSNKRPTISGVSFSSALILLSLNTEPVTSSSFNANAAGNWSYTPSKDLANGAYIATVYAENTATGKTETITSTFTVSDNVKGVTTASPSPSASTSATPSASLNPSPSSSATDSSVPVTGSVSSTLMLLSLSLGLFLISALTFGKR